MPSLLLSNPLGSDDAQEIGLEPRDFRVGEVITVDDYVFATLIRTGYGIPYGTTTDILLIGNGSPNASLGVDGQWYLDRLAEVLWGPKVGGYWPSNPIRPDRGVQQLALGADGHLRVTYSTGTVVDLGNVVGPANQLTAGTVTTGAAGSSAAAALRTTGVGQQALDLTIPRGDTGRGFTPRGAWATGTVYAVDDVVTANGSTWRALTAHTAAATFPGAGATWEQWARGFTPRGAWVTGTAYAVDDLVRYTDGSTYRVTTAHTSSATLLPTNTSYYSLLAQAGTAATVAVGTVTTGAAGSNAAVANAGTSAAAVLNFTIPQGPTGRGFTPRGDWAASTAYAVDDLVRYAGSTWRVTTAHTSTAGATPDVTTASYTLFAQAGSSADATTTAKGIVQLAGDLAGTAAAPTVVAVSAATPSALARRDTAGRLQVVDGAVAADVATLGQVQAANRTPPRVQAAPYTFGLADEAQWIYYNTATTPGTFTIPTNTAVPFPIGGWIDVAQWGTGPLTIQADVGVQVARLGVLVTNGSFVMPGRYSVARLLKTAVNTWAVYDLSTEQDSGWVPLTPATGYTATNFAVRRIGDQVYLRGNVTRTAGNFGTSTYETITTLPDPKFRAGTYTRAQTPLFASATATANVILVADPATNDLTIGGNGTSTTAYLGAVSYLAT